jgi:ribosome-associated protein
MTDLPISKTRRKKEMHALQDLGEVLVGLNASQLAGLELPERLGDAIEQARKISGFEARRRQMQYIGRLMRDIDAAPIAARVQQLQTEHQRVNARQHEIERWRDRLLGDEAALTELAQTYAGIDTQQLRTLLRNARKEQAQGRPPHATRALFRALRDVLNPRAPPDAPPPAEDE